MLVVVVNEHSKRIDTVVMFALDHYSHPLFKFGMLTSATIYGILVLQFVMITNFILVYLLMQNFFIFVFNDLVFENPHLIVLAWKKLKNKIRDPTRAKIVKLPKNVNIIPNHFEKPKTPRMKAPKRDYKTKKKKKRYLSLTRMFWRKV